MLSLAAIRRRAPGWVALARREIGPIALVLLIAACVLVFRHLAEEVGEGDTRGFDRAILYALRAPGFDLGGIIWMRCQPGLDGLASVGRQHAVDIGVKFFGGYGCVAIGHRLSP